MNKVQSLTFTCPLPANYQVVKSGFNIRLFEALCPPFPEIRILRFDGVRNGDLVQLELNFFLFKWQWWGVVIHEEESESHFLFVDSGEKLPPFLSSWTHEHRIAKTANGCSITDEIRFSAGKWWPDALVRLMVILQMKPRRSIYRKYFCGHIPAL